MSDYIERQAVIDSVKKNFKYLPGYMNATINYIKELPSADVVPVEELKAEIYKLKHQSEQGFGNHDYYVGYISALSTVEGILAVMDREE